MVSMTYSAAAPTPAELRDLARKLAVETAELVADKRRQLSSQGDLRDYSMTKSSAVDPVTVVDTLAEDHLVERIAELRPLDGVIGEEGSDKASDSGIFWVIDPIDGTVNFLYGIPHYAISVAAAVDGDVVAGAVANVVTGEVYTAARGEGAVKTAAEGDRELRVNDVDTLSAALVATGFGYTAARRRIQGEIVGGLLEKVRDIRRLGSAALDLCHLAEGRVDAYYENGIHCWDFAAGALIAREAGAVVQTPPMSVSGTEGRLSFAAAPNIASEFTSLLEGLGANRPLGP